MDEKSVTCLILLVVIGVIESLLAWCVMYLWNWLMPMLFGLPEINFWIALGLMFLLGLLFPRGGSK